MYDVLAIGTATRDLFLKSPLFKVLRDPEHLKRLGFPTGEAECFALGAKVEIPELEICSGGGAINAAVSFARQGLRVAALAKLGGFEDGGREISNQMKQSGVYFRPSFSKKLKTSQSVVMLAPTGERTILNYRGASEELRALDWPRSLRAKWAYIAPGRIAHTEMRKIIERLVKSGTNFAINPSAHYLQLDLKQLLPLLRPASVLILNREEAALLSGCRYEQEKNIIAELDRMLPCLKVITDGPRGVMVSDGASLYRSGIYSGKVIDRTGAGDAFGAGFVASLARLKIKNQKLKIIFSPEQIREAIRLGSANATSVVEKIGAHTGALTKAEYKKDKRWHRLDVHVQPIAKSQ